MLSSSQHSDVTPWVELPAFDAERRSETTAKPAAAVSRADPAFARLEVPVIADTGHLRRFYPKVGKRLLDLTVTLAVLPFFLLVLPLVALLIRWDSPGPIFFRQTRIGRNGKPFTLWKFRTMRQADGDGFALLRDRDGTLRHKIADDPRVTRVGRFLRRTSLDELPQIINVLLGQMSVVGPRPELPRIVRTYQEWQHQRHLVKPGLTGWWQINGRSDRPMHENTEYDLYYVARLSWGFDLVILWRTIRFVVRGTGAF